MNAIRGLINNNNLRIVAGGIILFCSILDLSCTSLTMQSAQLT